MIKYDFLEEAKELTKELVAIPSMNGSDGGEHNIACFIEEKLRKLPYFQQHEDQVIMQPLAGDKLERYNVIGIVRGEKRPSDKTIILHAHMDTVGVDDYGLIKEFAFSCDELPEQILKMTDDAEVTADIRSGDWMFGRGVADMKCGIAVNFAVLHYLTEHLDDFEGNVIFMSNPVEENQHTGIRNAVRLLEKWKKERGYEYLMAINNDFISPAYPGDETQYFHAGAVGKILPCFYCIGKPTHAGQAYEGFSVSQVMSEIVREFDCSADYCDVYGDEFTAPPIALKVKDLKPSYDVQSAYSGFVYFNYMIHQKSISEIMNELKSAAAKALQASSDKINVQYEKYCGFSGIEYKTLEFGCKVYDYSEIYAMAGNNYEDDIDEFIRTTVSEEIEKGTDFRDISRIIVEKLCVMCRINTPAVVVFFAPPYCPRNTLYRENNAENQLFEEIDELLSQQEKIHEIDLKLLHFFPVLTDSSYLKIDDDAESIRDLKNNFPAMDELFEMPLDTIKELSIPALNFGCRGKDAHKWTERVNIPYTFGILPQIILAALEKYLMAD